VAVIEEIGIILDAGIYTYNLEILKTTENSKNK
jgi:hypothetical protein